jgi:hypothetical protein
LRRLALIICHAEGKRGWRIKTRAHSVLTLTWPEFSASKRASVVCFTLSASSMHRIACGRAVPALGPLASNLLGSIALPCLVVPCSRRQPITHRTTITSLPTLLSRLSTRRPRPSTASPPTRARFCPAGAFSILQRCMAAGSFAPKDHLSKARTKSSLCFALHVERQSSLGLHCEF